MTKVRQLPYGELAKKGLNIRLAMEEASRCLLCDDAPCSHDCPAGTDPGRFIRAIRFRNFKGAARIIRETALAEGIPIMEDRPLARALYAKGKIDDFIPDSLIEPVAEVLKWAKQIQDARKEEEELDSVTLEDL